MFEQDWADFWTEFGPAKKMVLSTAANNVVSSRMMSVIHLENKLYFQTDCNLPKYQQLQKNSNVALCIDNIQIQGKCYEIGHPLQHDEFAACYKKYFPSSFERYSSLENEVLFCVEPLYLERWIYRDGIPFQEVFDYPDKLHSLTEYTGKA